MAHSLLELGIVSCAETGSEAACTMNKSMPAKYVGQSGSLGLAIRVLLQVYPADAICLEFDDVETPAFGVNCDSRRRSKLHRRSARIAQHAEEASAHVKYLHSTEVTVGYENSIFKGHNTLGSKQLTGFDAPGPDEVDKFAVGVENLDPGVDRFDHQDITLVGDVGEKRESELPESSPE